MNFILQNKAQFAVAFGLFLAHCGQNYLITVVLGLIVHWYYATDLGAGSLAIDDCNTVDHVGFNAWQIKTHT